MDPKELESVELFRPLTGRERRLLAQWADLVDVPAGKVLMEQGSRALEFLIIISGSAQVTRDGHRIRDLGPGDFFGEIALLKEDHSRTASVATTSPMRAVVLTGPQFRSMVSEIPQVAERVREMIRARLESDASGSTVN